MIWLKNTSIKAIIGKKKSCDIIMSDSKIQRAKKQCEKLKEMSDEYWEMFEDYHKMELELEEVKKENKEHEERWEEVGRILDCDDCYLYHIERIQKQSDNNERFIERIEAEVRKVRKNKCRFGGTLNDKYLDEMLVVNNNVKNLLHPFFKEIKDLKEQLINYHTMMTACDKSVDFAFGIRDREVNPELLDDLDHIPYHLKQLTEENKRLKEEQFDNMEELAKRDGMCLVDIHLYDKLIEKEKQYDELKGL